MWQAPIETLTMRFAMEVIVTFSTAFFSLSLSLPKEILHVAAWEEVLMVILIRMKARAVAVKQRSGWAFVLAMRRGAEVGIKMAATDFMFLTLNSASALTFV